MESKIIEAWKPIDGTGGRYEISSTGRVKSVVISNNKSRSPLDKSGILRCWTSRSGYQMIKLLGEHRLVHRLVAAAFCEQKAGCPQVNHINGVKADNRRENLEWCTASQNQKHALETGLRRKVGKITPSAAAVIRRLADMGMPHKEIASVWGLSRRSIWNIANGRT